MRSLEMVGLPGVGKTSLLEALRAEGSKAPNLQLTEVSLGRPEGIRAGEELFATTLAVGHWAIRSPRKAWGVVQHLGQEHRRAPALVRKVHGLVRLDHLLESESASEDSGRLMIMDEGPIHYLSCSVLNADRVRRRRVWSMLTNLYRVLPGHGFLFLKRRRDSLHIGIQERRARNPRRSRFDHMSRQERGDRFDQIQVFLDHAESWAVEQGHPVFQLDLEEGLHAGARRLLQWVGA